MERKFKCNMCGQVAPLNENEKIVTCPRCGEKYINRYYVDPSAQLVETPLEDGGKMEFLPYIPQADELAHSLGADSMLVVSHLKKIYPKSDRVAVDDISFALRPGEIFGFLGQNGAGKSTTIKCLTGILPFDSGSIEVCGYDIVKDPIKAKMNMGYVPDNHSVYEKLTGREYVNYVADLYKVPTDVRHERLEKFAKLFKLEFAIDRQIKSYSHGMKQKICIIAALIHDPKLWVLDEPMMGLDPQSTAEIIAYMREHCAKGNTVFFSSHNLDLVKKLCHRVAIVNEGRLIDMFDLAGNEANKANLEERFFRITGTYEERLFEDYVAQESADMRPDMPVSDKSEGEGEE